MRLSLATIFCALVLSACAGKATRVSGDGELKFHTSPDRWPEPRIYHTPFDKEYTERISVSRIALTDVDVPKVASPNKAYWFTPYGTDTMKPGPYDFRANIYNERDYLVRLTVSGIYGNYEPEIRWINEKLLYVEIWWGRIKGADFILDVEDETVIHKEDIHWGGIPFQQWQQAKDHKGN